MLYCVTNYKTKKALKDAVASGVKVAVMQTEPHEPAPMNGTAAVGGPWFPEAHKWYAQVTITNGFITKVK